MYVCHVNGWNRVSLATHPAIGWTPRDEAFAVVLLDRFAITLWRRRPGSPSHRS